MRENVQVATVIGACLIVATAIFGAQLAGWKVHPATVVVQGSAEIPVAADIATWNLRVEANDDDLKAALGKVRTDVSKIRDFLIKYGLDVTEISDNDLNVHEQPRIRYSENDKRLPEPRFKVSSGVTVRTTKFEAVQKAKNDVNSLMDQGVILMSTWGPNYMFSKLNDAKPELVSKATLAAKQSAEQFAKDSGATLGGVQSARQGSVMVRGQYEFMSDDEQINKVLRVVMTVEYGLK